MGRRKPKAADHNADDHDMGSHASDILQASNVMATPRPPRRAKQNALENAVWLQAAGSATARKRAASPNAQPAKGKRKKSRVVVTPPHDPNVSEKENENVLINIPVPPTPRKPRPVKKGKAKAIDHLDEPADSPNEHARETGKDPKDLFNSSEDASDSCSESGLDTAPGMLADPKALKKLLLDERPTWSSNKTASGESSKARTSGKSKLSNKPSGPVIIHSQLQDASKARTSGKSNKSSGPFIIHSRLPDAKVHGESANNSPTPHLVPAVFSPMRSSSRASNSATSKEISRIPVTATSSLGKSSSRAGKMTSLRASGGIAISEALGPGKSTSLLSPIQLREEIVPSSQTPSPLVIPNDNPHEETIEEMSSASQMEEDMPSDELVIESITGWPKYTDLVKGTKGISLKVQRHHIKLAFHRTFDLIEEHAIFHNSFPRVITRTVWNRQCWIRACEHLGRASPASVQERYKKVGERIANDPEYLKDISTVLDVRISHYRGQAKVAAANNVIKGYGTHTNTGVNIRLVNELIYGFQYIYPKKGSNYDASTRKAYENTVISDVLRQLLFSPGNSVLAKYPRQFNSIHVPSVSIAMIALASTAIHCALDEWRDGIWKQVKFESKTYSGIYEDHVKNLRELKKSKSIIFNQLTRQIYYQSTSGIVLTVQNK
ncbi:hypothetical protein F5887DRAFT_925157 [Amanita rubescens]|nr:hypothetical protein F5887DRAFT_925157 [Amanita rubescens]